jgi:hypothetical protein
VPSVPEIGARSQVWARRMSGLIARAVRRTSSTVAVAVAIGIALVPVTPQSVCACSTKLPAYVTAMRSDLRNLFWAEEAFESDSGRYTTVDTLISLGRYLFSTGVTLEEMTLSGQSYTARVRHAGLLEITCTISSGTGSPGDDEPQCTPFARDVSHGRYAIVYFALFGIALLIQLGHRVLSNVRFSGARVSVLVGLALLHPFWDRLTGIPASPCNAFELDPWMVVLVAATAALFFFNPGEPRGNDQSSTADRASARISR